MVKVPDMKRMREHIDYIGRRRDRVLIKTLYLTAARASELATRTNPSAIQAGKSKSYGRFLSWKIEDLRINQRKVEKALAITLAVAKRRLRTKEQKEQGYIPKVIAQSSLIGNVVYVRRNINKNARFIFSRNSIAKKILKE